MTSKVHMTCRILFFPAKTSFCLDDSVGAFSPRGIQFLQVFRGSRVCCSLLQRPLPGVSCLDILWRLVKAFWIVSCAAACCISCLSRFRPCAGLSRAFWHLVRLTRASVLSPTAVQLVAGVGKRVSWPSREGWGSVTSGLKRKLVHHTHKQLRHSQTSTVIRRQSTAKMPK